MVNAMPEPASPWRRLVSIWRTADSGVREGGPEPVRRRLVLGTAPAAATMLRLCPAPVLATLTASRGSPARADGTAGGKAGLTTLTDRPLNAETPAHLLDPSVTPIDRFFVRNNGLPPTVEHRDADSWVLEIAGESCLRPMRITLGELKRRFPHHTYRLVIECAGNGRREYTPATPGNQWSVGAVGCAEWTGVRLRDVLTYCGIADDAVYVAYEGADRHLSGNPDKRPISRGVPVDAALEDEALLAWQMNGAPLPPLHGQPLRLVIAGRPGSVSGKWLTRLLVRDRVHDGAKMGGKSYRLPCRPVAPGTKVDDADMCIIERLPVKSLITAPRSGSVHEAGDALPLRGHAWSGEHRVAQVQLSMDFGQTWQEALLEAPVNRLAWQDWHQRLTLPTKPGYYEIWARAVDTAGRAQPMVLPGWNPKGYLNNACHRIAIRVT